MEDKQKVPDVHTTVTADEALPSYEDTPAYSAISKATFHDLSLTLDPTGRYIVPLALNNDPAPPLYELSSSLFNVNDTSPTLQILRLEDNSLNHTISRNNPSTTKANPALLNPSTKQPIYAIAHQYIRSSQTDTNRSLEVWKTRHFTTVTWDFSTKEFVSDYDNPDLPRDYSAGNEVWGAGQKGRMLVQKHLLQWQDGRWTKGVVGEGEVIAVERDVVHGGMGVLNIVGKEVEGEDLDLLVSAWCVRHWGQVKEGGRRKSSFGFGIGK